MMHHHERNAIESLLRVAARCIEREQFQDAEHIFLCILLLAPDEHRAWEGVMQLGPRSAPCE